FFFCSHRDPCAFHSFPTRRSSDLFYLQWEIRKFGLPELPITEAELPEWKNQKLPEERIFMIKFITRIVRSYFSKPQPAVFLLLEDRKSTRLNSSHVKSSYAVFCLK